MEKVNYKNIKIMENQNISQKKCNLCGADMLFKEGLSKKNGKAWKGYFCQNKEVCGDIEWLRTNISASASKQATGANNASGNDKIIIANEMMLKLDELVRGQKIIIDLLQRRDDEDISGVPFK